MKVYSEKVLGSPTRKDVPGMIICIQSDAELPVGHILIYQHENVDVLLEVFKCPGFIHQDCDMSIQFCKVVSQKIKNINIHFDDIYEEIRFGSGTMQNFQNYNEVKSFSVLLAHVG